MPDNDCWLIPFGRDPKPEDLFLSTSYKEALVRLEMMVQYRYLGLLTGEVGSGKSTLIRRLFASVDPLKYQPVYLNLADMKPRDFYAELLCYAGERPLYSLTKAKRLWGEILEERVSQNDRTFLVVIDEAQFLSDAMLTELRFTMSHRLDSCSLFPLILVAQPEIRRPLILKKNAALAQRIQLSFHLSGLSNEEVAQYVRHRMSVAAVNTPVFAEGALTMLHSATQGIPRLINQFASQALLEATAKNLQVIDDNMIGRVLADYDRQRKPA
jgi:type II secretory pathway predicted ATPase ExeA